MVSAEEENEVSCIKEIYYLSHFLGVRACVVVPLIFKRPSNVHSDMINYTHIASPTREHYNLLPMRCSQLVFFSFYGQFFKRTASNKKKITSRVDIKSITFTSDFRLQIKTTNVLCGATWKVIKNYWPEKS